MGEDKRGTQGKPSDDTPVADPDERLREEDVTAEDRLDDRLSEGLPGD